MNIYTDTHINVNRPRLISCIYDLSCDSINSWSANPLNSNPDLSKYIILDLKT